MSVTARHVKHLGTIWRGEKCWQWAAIKYGHVQPRGFRTYRRSRWLWQVHITPIHIARESSSWEFGLCWGKRTVYVLRHR